MDLLQLPSELLYLWHTHRTEVLLSVGVLFAVVRLALHWRTRLAKEALTPPALSPIAEKSLPVQSVEPNQYTKLPAPRRRGLRLDPK